MGLCQHISWMGHTSVEVLYKGKRYMYYYIQDGTPHAFHSSMNKMCL